MGRVAGGEWRPKQDRRDRGPKRPLAAATVGRRDRGLCGLNTAEAVWPGAIGLGAIGRGAIGLGAQDSTPAGTGAAVVVQRAPRRKKRMKITAGPAKVIRARAPKLAIR